MRIIIFIIWGSAEVQPWNNPQRLTSPENGNTSVNQNGENNNSSTKRYDLGHLHDEKENNGTQVFTVEKVIF